MAWPPTAASMQGKRVTWNCHSFLHIFLRVTETYLKALTAATPTLAARLLSEDDRQLLYLTVSGGAKNSVNKKHMTKRKISPIKSQSGNPSEITDAYWISADRRKGKYFKQTEYSGKWLVFVPLEKIDEVWSKIKKATEEGLLGQASKVATAKKIQMR